MCIFAEKFFLGIYGSGCYLKWPQLEGALLIPPLAVCDMDEQGGFSATALGCNPSHSVFYRLGPGILLQLSTTKKDETH